MLLGQETTEVVPIICTRHHRGQEKVDGNLLTSY